MNNEHKLYIKSIKRKKLLIHFFRIIIIVFFVSFWQISANNEWINTFILSSPKKVLDTLYSLYKDGSLFHHIWITVYETLISFSAGSLLGILIASLLWRFKILSKIFDPYLTILNSLPKVALGPIIIIIGGSGTKSIIIMALLISVIITIINVHNSFINTDINKIKLLKSFGANNIQIFFKLILPENLGTIISSFKINISMSLIGVIMGEFLVSKAGLGYLILYGSQVFNLNLVISGIIVLMIVAGLMYYTILYIEKKLKY